jgi:hypothetical protein
MRTLAVSSLFLTVGSLLVIGGAILALFVFFPLFLLGLVGVIGRLPDRTVRERNPSMNPSEWRGNS